MIGAQSSTLLAEVASTAVAASQSATVDSERIWFADVLRALSALLIMAYHLSFLFWSAPAISVLIGEKQATWLSSWGLVPAFNLLRTWNIEGGSVGVSLLFLISGFVIPFSLERNGIRAFLVRRFFRIYPSYVCSLLLVLGALWLKSCAGAQPFPYSLQTILMNAFIVQDLTGTPSVDGIIWTLEIEVRFYLLCAALAYFRGGLTATTVSMTAAIIALLGWASLRYFAMPVLAVHASRLIFIFIGIAFYSLFSRTWSRSVFMSTSCLLLGLCIFSAYYSAKAFSYEKCTLNSYLVALAIFSICYGLRAKIPKLSAIAVIADLSYAIYLVHGVLGYLLMWAIYQYIASPPLATLVACAAALLFAWIFNKNIVRPTNKMGHRVASWLAK
jgi:peptidoglycan/LPS O-acetylase OafA/YrhL